MLSSVFGRGSKSNAGVMPTGTEQRASDEAHAYSDETPPVSPAAESTPKVSALQPKPETDLEPALALSEANAASLLLSPNSSQSLRRLLLRHCPDVQHQQRRHHLYWTEAHRLSCLRHRSLRSSAVTTRSDFAVSDDEASAANDIGIEGTSSSDGRDASSSNCDVNMVRAALQDASTFVGTDGALVSGGGGATMTTKGGESTSACTSASLLVVRGWSPQKASRDDSKGNGVGGEERQLSSAAKFIGESLLRSTSASGSGNVAGLDLDASRAAADTIVKGSSSSAAATATPASSTGGGGVLSTTASLATSLVTGAAWTASSVATSVFRTYGLTDYRDEVGVDDDDDDDYGEEDDYYCQDGADGDKNDAANDAEYDDAAAGGRRRGDKFSKRAGSNAALLDENEAAINVRVLVECCQLVLDRVRRTDAIEEDEGAAADLGGVAGDASEEGRVMLHRFGTGPGTASAFFVEAGRVAAAAAAAQSTETELESSASAGKAPTNTKVLDDSTAVKLALDQARGEVLAGLGPADVDLLVLSLLSAGYASISSDGDVVALRHHPLAATKSFAPPTDHQQSAARLSDVDVAIFKLRSTIASLERRMITLTEQAERAQVNAIAAKRSGQKQRALNYMKRRQLLLAEVDRTASTILNVEGALHGLKRAESDAQVVKCYEMVGTAMKHVRRSEEDGGLGLSAGRVEEIMDTWAEEAEELRAIGDLWEVNSGGGSGVSASAVAMGCEGGSSAIDEEELMKEFEALEMQVEEEQQTKGEALDDVTAEGGKSPCDDRSRGHSGVCPEDEVPHRVRVDDAESSPRAPGKDAAAEEVATRVPC